MNKSPATESAISAQPLQGTMAGPGIPRSADVVVVGGGCMGASVGFHLARRGVRVVVLDKAHVASGATGHSGALVRQHYETRIGIQLASRSLAFFQRFEKETGFPCDFRTTGFLSGTREKDLPAFEALLKLLRNEGVPMKQLAPSEAKRIEPEIELSDYVALVYDAASGYADPIATATGFAAACAAAGGVVLEDRAATSVVTRAGRVVGVKVRGSKTIASERVVLAAGSWTPKLAAALGVRLPVSFIRGEIAILRRPVGFVGAPKIHFDFYGDTYSRPDGDKDTLVGYFRTDVHKTIRDAELKDDSVSTETVRDLRRRLARRFPKMARAQPRGGWAGVYDVTPDSYPILDRIGPRGLFVAAGFSGHGFKLSPEVGRLMTEYVVAGRRPTELDALRASRFEEKQPVRLDAPFPARRPPRLA